MKNENVNENGLGKVGGIATLASLVTSLILFSVNYYFIEKPKYDLETKKIELDKKRQI